MSKYQLVKVGKRTIKLSNLEKVLFPASHIIKAELINYYLQVAPYMLRHIKRRPLSLIRYPDGIDHHQFFQKDKPDWAPEWINSVSLGKGREKEYVYAEEEALLVWLANLACIELHIRQDKTPRNDFPDFFMFDLDPGPNQDFKEIKEIAFGLQSHVESFNYHPFVKTSGGKGLHIFIPIEAEYDYDTMFACVKNLAEDFVRSNPQSCTLKINKDARKGKMLIDIYRNRGSQTIVAPYSLRGREKAPVSMPISWQELESIESAQHFTIESVPEKLKHEGDAWEGFASFAVRLHTDKSGRAALAKKLPESKFFKTPQQLKEYQKKRDFNKTPEPQPRNEGYHGHDFVIHRHHASRLHYDLRLEKDGSLLSWAVPKGLPHKPGIKRLAVETEPHPVEYLQFDGEIPKGQYGGGMMWIFARGKYEITKEKKQGFYFQLSSPQIDGEFRIHETKKKEWLLERVDPSSINLMEDTVAPMLADIAKKIPSNESEYLYEIKWDGIRAMIFIEEGEIKIRSRSQRDITDKFPELTNVPGTFRCANGIFDAEIVCLDPQGRPDFKKVISRMHSSNEARINQLSRSRPAYCYLFDCLYLDGRWLINDPIELRKDWLQDSIKKQNEYRISQVMEDGEALFEAAKKMDLEGVIAKRKKSKYSIAKRSKDWLKIKHRSTAEVLIIGYTEGSNDRANLFGALHLMEKSDDGLIYRGKVGTGFDTKKMKEILDQLNQIERLPKPVIDVPVSEKSYWVEPELGCKIEYASITDNQTFREPVFVTLLDF